MSSIFKKYGKSIGIYIIFFTFLWIGVFIIFPQIFMANYSLWKYDDAKQELLWNKADKLDAQRTKLELGIKTNPKNQKNPQIQIKINNLGKEIKRLDALSAKPMKSYTFDNYKYLFGNSLHRNIFFRTIWSSILVALISLLVCYPLAYYLAQVASKKAKILLFLGIIIPYGVNELTRTFAWFMILSARGIINNFLMYIGLINTPINFFQNNSAAYLGMVYVYVLFMLFPIYNILETLDKNQILAARDLGSSWFNIHRRIVIPYAKPGIAIGVIFVFMLAVGSYAVPSILGGTKGIWFTQIIYSWFFDGGDWNQGCAYALVLLVFCLVFIMTMLKVFKVRLEEVAK